MGGSGREKPMDVAVAVRAAWPCGIDDGSDAASAIVVCIFPVGVFDDAAERGEGSWACKLYVAGKHVAGGPCLSLEDKAVNGRIL